MTPEAAQEEYDKDPEAFEIKYGPQAVKDVLRSSVHFVPFPTDDKEPYIPSFKEDKWGDTAVWAAKEPFEEAKERFLKAGYGATIDIPKTDNALMRAYMQSLDYLASTGLAGLEASDAAFKFAVGAASELIPNGSNQVERRFTRDVGSMPDAFLGASPSNVKRATDNVAESFKAAVDNEVSKAMSTHKQGGVSIFAAANFDNGSWDKDLKDRAIEMKEAGVDDYTVWNETGFQFNPLKRSWNYEIDNSGMKLKTADEGVSEEEALKALQEVVLGIEEGEEVSVSLTEILDFPELFDKYPELKGTSVSFQKGDFGSFNAQDRVLTVGSDRLLDMDKLKDVLVHELQHGVQSLDGTVAGSSQSWLMRNHPDFKDEFQRILEGGTNEEWSEFQNKVYGAYRSNAGEIEARAAAMRNHLTTYEKQTIPPSETLEMALDYVYKDLQGFEVPTYKIPRSLSND